MKYLVILTTTLVNLKFMNHVLKILDEKLHCIRRVWRSMYFQLFLFTIVTTYGVCNGQNNNPYSIPQILLRKMDSVQSYAYSHKYIFAFEKITDKMGKKSFALKAHWIHLVYLSLLIFHAYITLSQNECYKEAAPSTPTIGFGGGGIYYIEEIFFMVKCSWGWTVGIQKRVL